MSVFTPWHNVEKCFKPPPHTHTCFLFKVFFFSFFFYPIYKIAVAIRWSELCRSKAVMLCGFALGLLSSMHVKKEIKAVGESHWSACRFNVDIFVVAALSTFNSLMPSSWDLIMALAGRVCVCVCVFTHIQWCAGVFTLVSAQTLSACP